MHPASNHSGDEKVSFGFSDVERKAKVGLVRGVFDAVANRYDLMNDLMSLGLHRTWKNALVDALAPRNGMQLLDLAGGTGDIAHRFLTRAPQGEVTVLDINEAMLREGRDRSIDRNAMQGISWLCSNAEHLPFADASWDACTIAFGIRNVTDIPQALREIRRVLKPGGRFLCLEFSPLPPSLFERFYEAYSFHVIPRIGQAVAGSAEPYRYLVESIRRFPNMETFARMMTEAGLDQVRFRSMSRGIVALHSGWRI